MDNLSSNDWIRFQADPNEGNFIPIYDNSKAMVWTLCLRILGAREDALDAYQATWCRLFVETKNNKDNKNVIKTGRDGNQFIYQLAIREAQNLRKRRARRVRKELAMEGLDLVPGHEPRADAQAAQNQLHAQLEAFVALLPDDCRLPLQLNLFHDLSQKEISDILLTTQSTVSRRIDKGVKQLKILIRRAGMTEEFKGGIVLGAGVTLFQPPEALGACAVYAKAQASIAAGGLATATVTSNLGTLSTKLLTGVAIMKSKIAVLGMLAAIALLTFVINNEFSSMAGNRSKSQEESITSKQINLIEMDGEEKTTGSIALINAEKQNRAGEMMLPEERTANPYSITIVGRVTDSESKRPIPEARIRITDEIKTISDSRGFYELKGPIGGTAGITASAKNYADRQETVHIATSGPTRNNFELDPAIDITVQVTDDAGAPVAGAKIDVDGFHVDFIERVGITDDQGQLVVTDVSRIKMPNLFEATKTGYLRGICKKNAISINSEKTDGTAKIVMKAVGDMARVITGEIKDAQGKPVPSVTVQWSPVLGRQEGRDTTLTEAEGHYILAFEHETKDCQLSVYGKGWAPAVREGILAGTADKPAVENFTMGSAHWLAGRVVDVMGNPVASARVEVMPERRLLHSWSYPGVKRQAVTDADGRFLLEDLSGPQVALDLRGPGDDWSDQIISSQNVDKEVTLTLKCAGVVLGRVIDKETGEPVPTFNIKLRGNRISVQRINPGETFNSSEGEFVLRDLNQGYDYDVTVEAEGYVSVKHKALVALSENEAMSHEFKISHGREIQGYVIDAKTNIPIEGAKVSHGIWDGGLLIWNKLDGRMSIHNLKEMTVDSSGQFSFIEDEPGAIFIQAKGYRHVIVKPEDRKQYQMNPQCLWIPVKQGESIRGICFVDGRPAKAYLGLTLMGMSYYENQYYGNIVVQDGGSFEMDSLVPGTYEMDALWRFDDGILRGGTRYYRQFVLSQGERKEVNIGDDLGELTFSGRLLDMHGKPLDCVLLTLSPDFNWSYAKFEAAINAVGGGLFKFPNLKSGRYEVEVIDFGRTWPQAITLPPIEITGDLVRDIQIEPVR